MLRRGSISGGVWQSVATYLPFAVVLGVLTAITDPRRNDFFQFWYAGHLVAVGVSPYDQAAWAGARAYGAMAASVVAHCPTLDAPACLWIYPPWTAWLFAPIGLLTADQGIVAIELISIVSLSAGIAAALYEFVRDRRIRTVALPAFLASAPAVRDAVTGHFEGLLLIGVALLVPAITRGGIIRLIAAVLLLSLKPHLALLLAAIVIGRLALSRAWRALGAVLGTMAAISIIGIAVEPRWAPAMVEGAIPKLVTSGNSSLLASAGIPVAIDLALLLAAATATFLIVRWAAREHRVEALVAAGAALSLAATPYLQSYDDVLLVPAFALATSRGGAWGYAVIGISLLGGWVVYVLELSSLGGYAGLLPLLALLILVGYIRHLPALDKR